MGYSSVADTIGV